MKSKFITTRRALLGVLALWNFWKGPITEQERMYEVGMHKMRSLLLRLTLLLVLEFGKLRTNNDMNMLTRSRLFKDIMSKCFQFRLQDMYKMVPDGKNFITVPIRGQYLPRLAYFLQDDKGFRCAQRTAFQVGNHVQND